VLGSISRQFRDEVKPVTFVLRSLSKIGEPLDKVVHLSKMTGYTVWEQGNKLPKIQEADRTQEEPTMRICTS
jgi:hypothetical protein